MKPKFFALDDSHGLQEIEFDNSRIEVAEKIIEKLQEEVLELYQKVDDLTESLKRLQ